MTLWQPPKRFSDVSVRSRLLRPTRPELYKQERVTPEGWTLTEQVETALMEQLREGGQIDAERMSQIVSELPLDPILEDASRRIERDLVQNSPSLSRSLRGGEARIARQLQTIWGPGDRLFEALTYMGWEIGSSIARDNEADIVVEALLGLHARACVRASEVRLCAMNGFAEAAEARWRSLHEINVVAHLLSESGEREELAGRYVASAVAEQYDDALAYQAAAERLNREPLADREMADLKKSSDDVVATFGPRIRFNNGWAEPLFPDLRPGRPISFLMLEKKAGLDHMRPFYRLGSHSVHAGAYAGILGLVGDGTEASRRSGASVYADIAETCHGALISFVQTSLTVMFPKGEHDAVDRRHLDSLISAKIMLRWLEQAGQRYGDCSDAARARGWLRSNDAVTPTWELQLPLRTSDPGATE